MRVLSKNFNRVFRSVNHQVQCLFNLDFFFFHHRDVSCSGLAFYRSRDAGCDDLLVFQSKSFQGNDLLGRLDDEVAGHFLATDINDTASVGSLFDLNSNQLVITIHSHQDSVATGVILLDHLGRQHALEAFDTSQTDALLDHVHVGLVVPASNDDQLTLLTLGVLRSGQL